MPGQGCRLDVYLYSGQKSGWNWKSDSSWASNGQAEFGNEVVDSEISGFSFAIFRNLASSVALSESFHRKIRLLYFGIPNLSAKRFGIEPLGDNPNYCCKFTVNPNLSVERFWLERFGVPNLFAERFGLARFGVPNLFAERFEP